MAEPTTTSTIIGKGSAALGGVVAWVPAQLGLDTVPWYALAILVLVSGLGALIHTFGIHSTKADVSWRVVLRDILYGCFAGLVTITVLLTAFTLPTDQPPFMLIAGSAIAGWVGKPIIDMCSGWLTNLIKKLSVGE